jgi:hypothetical protein
MLQQPEGLLAVLLRSGVLRRGKKQRPFLSRPVEKQRGIYTAAITTVRARSVVQRAPADAFGQIGPLRQIDNEPNSQIYRLAALRAGDLMNFENDRDMVWSF